MKMRFAALFAAVMMLFAAGVGWAQGQTEAAPEAPARKVVYLTFDDGPKKDTPELLALLDELDVPATFFFVGAKVERFPENAKLVVEAGYPVGCHTMTHTYSRLKKSTAYVKNDIQAFLKTMRELVDPSFNTDLYRFPGGSSSYPSASKMAVVEEGFSWFDWNSLTGDTQDNMTSKKIYELAVKTSGDEEVIILLAHEGILRTRRILPDLVAYYREKGYEFRALATGEEDRRILERCPAKMMLAPAQTQKAQEE